jgi:hypothetical protein
VRSHRYETIKERGSWWIIFKLVYDIHRLPDFFHKYDQ